MRYLDVHLDAEAFSHRAVVATAHRHTDRFTVGVGRESRHWVLHFAADDLPADEEALRASILRDALDEQLRDMVRERTGSLHETLIRAALLGARPAQEF